MAEERKRPFRAADVLTGAVEKDREQPSPGPPAPAEAPPRKRRPKRPRKQVTLHLTYSQIETLASLYHRLNSADLEKKIEKSELGGLGIEILERLIPRNRRFEDIGEIAEYLNTQISKYWDTD